MSRSQFFAVAVLAVVFSFAGGMIGAALFVPSSLQAAEPAKELKVSKLTIVDRDGKERISLEVDDKEGFAGLGIGDRREKGRIVLAVTDKGEAMVAVADEEEKMRAAMMTDAYGKPYVIIMNEGGEPIWRVPE